MNAPCSRTWEAEAVRDGRLAGTERESFERHRTVCRDCAAEAAALADLANRFRDDDEPTDAFAQRRMRQRILSRVATSSPPIRRRVTWVVVALAGALAATIALKPSTAPPMRTEPLRRLADLALVFRVLDVDPAPGADWSRENDTEGPEIVTLREGTLRLSILRDAGTRELRVRTPDAEIEDQGTIFWVTVQAGRTTRLRVDEGSVVMRDRAGASRVVGAGETWLAASIGDEPAPPPKATSGAARPRLSSPISAAPSGAQPSPPSSSARSEDPAARELAAAMKLLRGGSLVAAADAFAAFQRDHQDDPRAEDAAYLRFVALAKAQRRAATRAAARDYLERFPHGLRAPEVRPYAAP